MAWFYLILASLCEIGWAIGLKYTQGLSDLKSSVITLVGYNISFVFLALAAKSLPISVAYAVWVGIGIAGISILGTLLFDESRSFAKLLFIALIIIGAVGLKLIDKSA